MIKQETRTSSDAVSGPAFVGWMLIGIVVVAPVPLGAARPWSAALLALLLALALLFWAAARLRNPLPLRIGLRRFAFVAGAFGLTVLWGFWQTLPLVPASWVHPLWHEAEAVLGPLQATVSLTPLAGRDAVMQWLAYGAAFFLAVQYGRDPVFAWRMIAAIALASTLYAAYGFYNVASGAEKIGWLDKWAYRGMATGTLVNANHFATLTGFGLLCCAALLLRRRETSGAKAKLLWWICVVILLATLPLTHSRAGMFTTVCGGLLLLALAAWRRQSQKLAFGIIAALAIGMASLLLVGNLGHIDWVASADHRFQVFHLTALLIAERPLLGTGLGSFMDAFAAIRQIGMVPNWNAAHNTYLELMLELGVPVALVLLAVEAWLIWRCLYGAARRQRHWLICALVAAVSLQLALHSLIDFSAQIPAVAVCWSVLLGLGVAQSWSSRLPGRNREADRPSSAPAVAET